jgi:hypothetical protein
VVLVCPEKRSKDPERAAPCVPWKQVLCSAEGLRRALYELLCLHGVVLALDSFAWQFTDGISRTKCRERGAGFGGRHASLGWMRCTVIRIGGRRNRSAERGTYCHLGRAVSQWLPLSWAGPFSQQRQPLPCPRMAPGSLALGKVGTNRVHSQGLGSFWQAVEKVC